MKQILHSYLKWVYQTPFRIIGFFYRTYTANRNRVKSLLAGPRVAGLLRGAMVLTVVVWIAIWFFASDANRNRLTESFKEYLHDGQP